MDYTEKAEFLYNEATKRAEHRNSNAILPECMNGYTTGIRVALGLEDDLIRVVSESHFGFAFVCGVLSVLEAIKGKAYKASWQADGEFSALPNIKRKYDRLKAMQGIMPGTVSLDEPRPTTSADLAVYAAKLTTWFNEFDPAGFKGWIKEVQKVVKDTEEATNAKQEQEAPSGSV